MLQTKTTKTQLLELVNNGTYNTEAGDLLTNWGGFYSDLKTVAYSTLARSANLFRCVNCGGDNFVKSQTAMDGSYYLTHSYNAENIERLFSLAFTSSGDFAALWVVNFEIVLKSAPRLQLKAIAFNSKIEPVYYFAEMEKGEQVGDMYFTATELVEFDETAKQLAAAERLDTFRTNADSLARKLPEILAPYAGKAIGEKRRAEIRAKLNYRLIGIFGYLENGTRLVVQSSHENLTKYYYVNYLDKNGKVARDISITIPEQKTTAIEALNVLPGEREKLRRLAAEMLPILDHYNELRQAIGMSREDRYRVNVENLANGSKKI